MVIEDMLPTSNIGTTAAAAEGVIASLRITEYSDKRPSPGAARHPLPQGERAEICRKIALSLWQRGDREALGEGRNPTSLSPSFVIFLLSSGVGGVRNKKGREGKTARHNRRFFLIE